MDNITHTITGLFLSRAGLNRITPLATPILIIAANTPDFDVVSALGGALSYFHWHRHLTHSVFVAPLLAIGLTFGFRFLRPGLKFLPAAVVALCGIYSHVLLDLTNVYGVRIFLPFQSSWYDWDLTPVIDFWIWAVYAIALAGPFLAGLVSSEIGGAPSPGTGRGLAIVALLFVVGYNGGRALVRGRVLQALNARVYDASAPVRVAAFPASMNPLHWRGVAETDLAYHVFEFKLPGSFNPSLAEVVRKAEPSPVIQAAGRTEPFQVFADFAQYPVYRVIPLAEPPGSSQIELSDLRFNFTSTALVDRQLRVKKARFQFGPANPH